MTFHGKVALVTGGTSGIGRGTAIQFARAGAKAAIAGRRTEEGNAVAKEIAAAGGEASFVQTDVASEEQVKRLVDETVQRFGRLDIAFNNAGVEQMGPLTEFTETEYRQAIAPIGAAAAVGSLQDRRSRILRFNYGEGVVCGFQSLTRHRLGQPVLPAMVRQ